MRRVERSSCFRKVFFEHQKTESLSRKTGNNTEKKAPEEGSKYYRFIESTEGSSRYRHQSQRVRTLSRGLEAAREGTPHNVREYSR